MINTKTIQYEYGRVVIKDGEQKGNTGDEQF